MLQRTKGGLIASVGLVVLFWSVVKVFDNIEKRFQRHLGGPQTAQYRPQGERLHRPLWSIVTPILWIISSSIRLQAQDQLLHLHPRRPPSAIFLFGLVVAGNPLDHVRFRLYKVIPNTKVRPRSARDGRGDRRNNFPDCSRSFMSTSSLRLTSYNAIYGSFAAFPLFLIWLQISWQIVLFGGELSFAYQNIKKFEYEKRAKRNELRIPQDGHCCVVMQQIIAAFPRTTKAAFRPKRSPNSSTCLYASYAT